MRYCGFLSRIFFQHRIEVVKIILEYKNLPKNLDNLRIAQISDTHLFDDGDLNMVLFNKSISILNELKPDVVLITGDITDIFHPEIAELVSPKIQRINCPVKYGVFGSHDIVYPTSTTKKIIGDIYDKVGLKMIDNQTQMAPIKNLRIIGCGSYIRRDSHPPRIEKEDFHENNIFNLCISHNPDTYDGILKKYKPELNLTCSGHTHGGQVNLPFTKKPIMVFIYNLAKFFNLHEKGMLKNVHRFVKRWGYSQGLFKMKKNQKYLYVNRGLGSHFSLRFFNRPEITLFTLLKKMKEKNDTKE